LYISSPHTCPRKDPIVASNKREYSIFLQYLQEVAGVDALISILFSVYIKKTA
jgi:hypothetical protein